MAISFPSPTADNVGVFDASFRQLFQNGRPLKATVRPRALTMKHPLEDGQITSDYRVILPIGIELPLLVLPSFYRDVYQEIKNLFLTSQLLIVQTRADIYRDMVLADMPHEETPEQFDVLTIMLHFEQAQIVSAQTQFAPADTTQGDTQALGQQNPTTVAAPASQSTIASFLAGGK